MTDMKIQELATKYRTAIEYAQRNGEFSSDIAFNRFPHACCGDTCYMLAEYLKRSGVETIWYSAERDGGTHAWLVVKDRRVKKPKQRSYSYPAEVWDALRTYGVENPEDPIDVTKYEEDDLTHGLIIDITADQFDDFDESVYVGKANGFHKSFEFSQANDYNGLSDGRLRSLYQIVEQYL